MTLRTRDISRWAARLVVLLASLPLVAATPIFNTVSIDVLGTQTNQNLIIQPDNRFNPTLPARTSNFQIFQQGAQPASGMACPNPRPQTTAIRVGALLISSSVFGPTIGSPIAYASTPASIVSPTSFDLLMQLSCGFVEGGLGYEIQETTFPTNSATGELTTQTCYVFYGSSASTVSPTLQMVDLNVVGNAMHDVQYDPQTTGMMTPFIATNGSMTLTSVKVGAAGGTLTNVPIGNSGTGSKFQLLFSKASGKYQQTWNLYAADSTGAPVDITFTTSQGSGDNPIILTSTAPFQGYLRFAVVAAAPNPQGIGLPTPPQPTRGFAAQQHNFPSESWALSAGYNALTPLPLAQYMLWPATWVDQVANQIFDLPSQCYFAPDGPTLMNMLPLLARSNFEDAAALLVQLNGLIPGQFVTPDPSTNTTLTFLAMLFSTHQGNAISSFQTGFTPLDYPTLVGTSTPVTMDQVYDAYSVSIPLLADIVWSDPPNGTYSFTYQVVGTPNHSPPIAFPSWIQLNNSTQLVTGFTFNDPFKGPLYMANGTLSGSAYTVTYKTPPLPSWAPQRIFPENVLQSITKNQWRALAAFLWFDLNPCNVTKIQLPNGLGVLDAGKTLYKLALELFYTSVLIPYIEANFPDIYTDTSLMPIGCPNTNMGAITAILPQLATNIINGLDSWLFTQNYAGESGADYFIGDTTISDNGTIVGGSGVVTAAGLTNATCADPLEDEANAIYNRHYAQYAYFLGAIAFLEAYQISQNINPTYLATQMNPAMGSNPNPPVKRKYVTDMLWRDTRNPDIADPDFPFNRHDNYWEAHSTDNGFRGQPFTPSTFHNARQDQVRILPYLSEDFFSWYMTGLYAGMCQLDPGLTATDNMGFSYLFCFSFDNLAMTSLAGKLWFNGGATADPLAIFNGLFGVNATTGAIYDWMVDGPISASVVPGQPAPIEYPAPSQATRSNRTFNEGRVAQEFGFVVDQWRNALSGLLPPPPCGTGTPQPPAPSCPSGAITTQ